MKVISVFRKKGREIAREGERERETDLKQSKTSEITTLYSVVYMREGLGFFSLLCFQDGRYLSRVPCCRQELETLPCEAPEHKMIHWKRGKQKETMCPELGEGSRSGVRN